jgi:hypothetical protein
MTEAVMTTEHPDANRGVMRRASPLELRLYVVALLAAVYTITWRVIGGHASGTESTFAAAPRSTTNEPQRFVWIDSLPPTLRPRIAMPAGWQLVSEQSSVAPESVAEPARVIRAPTRRVPRVRTRSS